MDTPELISGIHISEVNNKAITNHCHKYVLISMQNYNHVIHQKAIYPGQVHGGSGVFPRNTRCGTITSNKKTIMVLETFLVGF